MNFSRLGDITDLYKGKKPTQLVETALTGYKPYILIESLDGTPKKWTNDTKGILASNGDILIVWDGARAGLIGKSIEGYVGSTIAKVETNPDLIITDYLYYYLYSKYQSLNKNTRGTGIPHLDKNYFNSLEILVPTLSEQKQIVAKIKECFTLLDKSKEKLKQAEEKLNNVLDSSLLSLQRTNGDVYPLKDIVTIQKQTIKLDINSSSFYIALEDIEANTGKLLNTKYVTGREVKSTKLRFNTKHVLYSKLRPYLNKVIIPPEEGICVTDLLPLLPNEKVTQKYLYYYLRSPQIRDYINQKMAGIKMPRLRTEDLNNMPIFVPSIETQNNFVTRIERLTEEAYQCRISIEKQAKKQELLRQLLLKKAFEGKLI